MGRDRFGQTLQKYDFVRMVHGTPKKGFERGATVKLMSVDKNGVVGFFRALNGSYAYCLLEDVEKLEEGEGNG